MKIVRFSSADHAGIGFLEDGKVIDLSRAARMAAALLPSGTDVPPWVFDTIHEMLEAGLFEPVTLRGVRAFIGAHSLEEDLMVEGAALLAPLPRPPRIIALGLNYAAHARETGKEPPKEPIFFMKASTAVIGPDEPVVIPKGTGRVDHEVELAVVIGREGRNISRKKAADHIAGYTVLNDVTARDMQSRDMAASRPWFLSKSFDTFAPMGPCITLADEIKQPVHLDLTLRVNGEVRQKSNTRDLIFDIPELIHRLSRYITLEPGDVIATGTPSGISAIEPGDVMEAEIEKIGVLRNPVVAGK